MNIVVVGSGPAGVSVAKGLLERGCKVTLLDAGNVLESDKQNLLQQIRLNNVAIMHPSLRSPSNNKKKPKLPYGSNFVYAGVKNHFRWKIKNCYFQPSFAKGGLSNVWGSVLREYSQHELNDWPRACQDLSSYYARILAWLGPYYTPDTSDLLSQQARYLKNRWEENKFELGKKGFSLQTTKLACDFKQCCFCGSCQYGCPYGVIYHSSIHLNLLKQDPNFTYVKGAVLENFSEKGQQVELLVKYERGIERLFADRLFVACGAGLSSMLYLRSLGQSDKQLTLKDSQHFILPCLLDIPVKDVTKEELHTLCQLNLSLSKVTISPYSIYMQIYTYMDLYQREVQSKFKYLYPLVQPLIKSWMERLVIIQGYLDSKESNSLIFKNQEDGEYLIKTHKVTSSASTINAAINYLKQQGAYLGIKPLRFLLSKSLTGQSNHIGGSLPMSDNPYQDEVDIWGRPCHFKRIHFVDGSILPSIPAGPITLTIMANAYRIGKEGPL
ncbi:MAG: hypothetical protein A3F11_02945 [Gammaproteobacteria bacterium RIFCSPHIGHO2_12_FULL_37_14]|nr:MAG: hypothetical protein A3F11_02945 [Gammaproteobacteria bacterium RIFCSPHIGHO2_12_FULL_37_14]